MCSFWVTMEHDEGDLEAVVRAGRGLACSSFLGRNLHDNINTNGNNNNPSYNSWQSTATVGVEPGSTCFSGLQGAPPDDGGSVQRSSSQMVFPNLLRTAPAPAASPPGMDLQGLCSIPFYNGSILLRSASSASSSMFENVDVKPQACRFGTAGGRADSPTASMFASAQDMRPQHEQLNAEKKLCRNEEEFCRSPPSAFAPADSGLTDVPVSKPLEAASLPSATVVNTSRKVEGGDANSPLAHPKSEPGSVDSGMSTPTGPSPKNPGSKRRKTQQKRIVCVPAAGGSNRPSGEGLPSDLWAWRKYGQKPIKGSPYPRGYYRCSSSKGCSARKQVERSRTDPTMLVITYTSDHNHPWPTHRNALAGSTRQSNSAEKIASAVSQGHETTTTNNDNNNAAESSEVMAAVNPLNSSSIDSPAAGADQSEHGDNQTHNFNVQEDDEEQAKGLNRLFGATASDHPHHDDDFFADLGELPESLNVLALRHFDDDKSDDEAAGSMSMSSSTVADPFNLFNWSSSTFVDTETAM